MKKLVLAPDILGRPGWFSERGSISVSDDGWIYDYQNRVGRWFFKEEYRLFHGGQDLAKVEATRWRLLQKIHGPLRARMLKAVEHLKEAEAPYYVAGGAKVFLSLARSALPSSWLDVEVVETRPEARDDVLWQIGQTADDSDPNFLAGQGWAEILKESRKTWGASYSIETLMSRLLGVYVARRLGEDERDGQVTVVLNGRDYATRTGTLHVVNGPRPRWPSPNDITLVYEPLPVRFFSGRGLQIDGPIRRNRKGGKCASRSATA